MLLCACARDVKSEISQVRKFSWPGSGRFSNLRIQLLFRLQLPSIQLRIYLWFT